MQYFDMEYLSNNTYWHMIISNKRKTSLKTRLSFMASSKKYFLQDIETIISFQLVID